jgi:hypothetical protein
MKKILVFALGLVSPLFFAPAALAHCPLCVAGAGVGLSLSRVLGIDDSITGVWLAAFLGAISFWTETTFIKKQELRLILRPLIYVGIFATTIWSFYKFNLIVTHGEIFGIHKLTFGIIVGGVIFYLVDLADDLIIKKAGKVFFPYQRIIVSLGSMLLLSVGIYILINYYI